MTYERSYLQYRIPLQISADFYVFDLRELLSDPSKSLRQNELWFLPSFLSHRVHDPSCSRPMGYNR